MRDAPILLNGGPPYLQSLKITVDGDRLNFREGDGLHVWLDSQNISVEGRRVFDYQGFWEDGKL